VDALPVVGSDVRLGACVGGVGKIICIGLNYSDHAAESGIPVPEEPIIFFKATTAISGPYDDVILPRGSDALAIDANQRWDVNAAIPWLRQLAAFDIAWIEEPTSLDDVLGHAAIRRAAPIPVSTGEHTQNRVIFKQLFQANAVDLIQIDAARVGGVNENLAILLLAAKFGVRIPACGRRWAVRAGTAPSDGRLRGDQWFDGQTTVSAAQRTTFSLMPQPNSFPAHGCDQRQALDRALGILRRSDDRWIVTGLASVAAPVQDTFACKYQLDPPSLPFIPGLPGLLPFFCGEMPCPTPARALQYWNSSLQI
jgi:hypothetical protein